MKTANLMYWVNIVGSFIGSFMGSWMMAMGFLVLAGMFQCTGLILKEIQNGKREEGNSNSSSSVVETSA